MPVRSSLYRIPWSVNALIAVTGAESWCWMMYSGLSLETQLYCFTWRELKETSSMNTSLHWFLISNRITARNTFLASTISGLNAWIGLFSGLIHQQFSHFRSMILTYAVVSTIRFWESNCTWSLIVQADLIFPLKFINDAFTASITSLCSDCFRSSFSSLRFTHSSCNSGS